MIAVILSSSFFGIAEAKMLSQGLEEAFNNTDAVIDATVLRTERIEWSSLDKSGSCGYKVKVRIKFAFSGTLANEIEIGTKYPLVPGSRYLLFIDDRPSGFVVSDDITKQRDTCVRELPSLKSNWWFSSEIAGLYKEFVFFPGLLLVPNDLLQFTDTIGCKVYVNDRDVSEISGKNNWTDEESSWYDSIWHQLEAHKRRSGPRCFRTNIVPWKELSDWLKRLGELKANKALKFAPSGPDA